jgi:hypothetical protein
MGLFLLTSRKNWQSCQVFVGPILHERARKSSAELISISERLLNDRQIFWLPGSLLWKSQRKMAQKFLSEPFVLKKLVRLAGIEPTTPWFVAKYSIQLSYSRPMRVL